MLLDTYRKEVLDYFNKSLNKRGDAIGEKPLITEALKKIDEASDRNFFLVNAPTGYGKTFISMSIALHEFKRSAKTIIAYPLRALIEEQAKKIKGLFESRGIGGNFVGVRYMGSRESPYLVHPVTLTTIDTLSLTAMGLSPEDMNNIYQSMRDSRYTNPGHYLFSWSSVYSSSFIVLDEVHLMYDSDKSLGFLKALMDLCELMGVKMVLMTATFPSKFESVLYGKKVEKVKFDKDIDPQFYEERISKKYSIDLLPLKETNKLDKIKDILGKNEFKRALVIFNTVEDAVNFYKKIKNEVINREIVLLHSRFTNEDKKNKIDKLEELMNNRKEFIVVGTQAIEAGVNISSDLIITEATPPLSLVQRFGRFLRFNDEKEGKAFIWYEEDKLDKTDLYYKVYNGDLVRRTVDYLSGNKDLNLHVSYEDFINNVYDEEPQVKHDIVNELEIILLDLLEPTKSAMKLFLKMGGSFVREGSIFTVITKDGKEVSVSFDYLKRLKGRGLCKAYKDKEEGECPDNEYDALMASLEGYEFRVDVPYDSEVGLVEEPGV